MGVAGWIAAGILLAAAVAYLVNGTRQMKTAAIHKAEVVSHHLGQVVFIWTPGGIGKGSLKRIWGVLVSADESGLVYRDEERRERFLPMPAVIALEDFQGRTIAEF